MEKFVRKALLFLAASLLLFELLCRVFADPYFFRTIDVYQSGQSDKCLFIGSSRVPATIDKAVFARHNINCVVAGRGYLTAGIHLTALRFQLSRNPDYLRNANVFIEYAGYNKFLADAAQFQYQVPDAGSAAGADMPHLIFPYMDTERLHHFWNQSPNTLAVKIKLVFLYGLASYRCVLMLQEKQPIKSVVNKIFGKRKGSAAQQELDGGIKTGNDAKARKIALSYARNDSLAQLKSPELTTQILNRSILGAIARLVKTNGGRLFIYELPLHSVQRDVSLSPKAARNKHIFLNWLQQNEIQIIQTPGFHYQDSDFPDTWHLNVRRRAEFSTVLLQELVRRHIVVPQKQVAQQATKAL